MSLNKDVDIENELILGVNEGLTMIGNYEPPPVIRIKLARIGRVVRAEAELIKDERKKLLDQYAVFDGPEDSPNRRYKNLFNQKGEPIPNTVELKDKKAFTEEETKLYKAKTTLNIPLLTQEELEQMKISLQAQEALLPICEV